MLDDIKGSLDILIIVKWFSRKWYIVIIPLLLTGETIVWLGNHYYSCPQNNVGDYNWEMKHKLILCENKKCKIAIIYSLVNFLLQIVFLGYLPIDPIDYNLLINERAINLTSRYSNHFRKIVAYDQFKQEISIKEE